MKRFKLLLVALATVSFTAFYACGGEQKSDEGTQEEVKTEAPAEETPAAEENTEVKDSTAVENNEEATETPAEEAAEGTEENTEGGN